MTSIDCKCIEILKKHGSPTISDAIELFKVRPQNEGFLHSSIQSLFPELPPMVGYAVTMKFKSSEEVEQLPRSNEFGRQVEALLKMPSPRVVVIEDVDECGVGAAFGEMCATTYMQFGCAGIVCSGGARDTEAIHQKKLPLFAKSRNVSHGYPQIYALNVPVNVGGVTVNPGDLLHGDADGIVTIPSELAPQVAEFCEKVIATEEEYLDYLNSGDVTVAGVDEAAQRFGTSKMELAKEILRKSAG